MKAVITLLALTLASSLAASDTYLTPLDFGLSLMEHGMVDYCNTPPNIQVGNYNSDDYPDIARFTGNKLEIFLLSGNKYTTVPQQSRTFQQPIKSLRHDDDIWDGRDDLVVTFVDNSEKTFHHKRGCLDLNGTTGNSQKPEIPRRVSEADFEIVWESEPRPYGMDEFTVGDLDNDGILELVTNWKEHRFADTAYILIYKCIGNDEYELFMEEEFTIDVPGSPGISYLAITDIDQNGQKELIYTYNKIYFWEFSEPGTYTPWKSNFTFPRAVNDLKVCDIDQDNILEIAAVTTNSDLQPPTAYIVREFSYKSTEPENTIFMTSLMGIYQNWSDYRLDVGDFDNDGAVDIVSGNAGYVVSYDPIETQYFRYDPTAPNNFSQNWLYTGLPLRCVNPVIADMDNDEENELYAGGIFVNGGSAFIYEATGFQSGYVSWLDTISTPIGPNQSCFGMIDYNPSVLSIYIIPIFPTGSRLGLWTNQNSTYLYVWESQDMDSTFYNHPYIWDMDNDGKMSLLMADDIQHLAVDWEQTSAGIWEMNTPELLGSFQLNSVFPNPFNSFTIIPFEIYKPSDVELTIYDISGRHVTTLIDSYRAAGLHHLTWDAGSLPSGVYFANIQAGEYRSTQKLLLTK